MPKPQISKPWAVSRIFASHRFTDRIYYGIMKHRVGLDYELDFNYVGLQVNFAPRLLQVFFQMGFFGKVFSSRIFRSITPSLFLEIFLSNSTMHTFPSIISTFALL